MAEPGDVGGVGLDSGAKECSGATALRLGEQRCCVLIRGPRHLSRLTLTMNAIGFRAHPQRVWFAVVSQQAGDWVVKNVSHVAIPPALQVPAQLQFVRTTLLDIIGEYRISRAGIRTAEPSAQSIPDFRLNLEGVIQELLASGAVANYFAGPIATIAMRLGVKDRKDVKKYVEGEMDYPGATKWQEYGPEEREALLVALGALSLPDDPLTLALTSS